ncbi:hypothetical protein IP88_06800 [alpha proteobacterium AAP81b]|nr:hypothetical protein IP88_06800 [alpha proteobacterium AAP81b]
MSPFLIPITAMLIPVLGIVYSIVNRLAKLQEKRLEVTAKVTAEQAAQYAAKIATLEERVAVLNRIVTDRNEGLTAQIEALRDTPPAAPMPPLRDVNARN